MNGTVDQTPAADAAGTARNGLPAVGAALKTEREAQKLSVEEIGERLRLTPSTLMAIEAGQLDQLPSLTFIRGYVRSYARLLKLDEEPLLASLGEATAPISAHAASQPFTAAPRKHHRTRLPGRNRKWVGRVLLAALAAVVLAVGWRVASRLFPASDTAESDAPQLALPRLGDVAPEAGEAADSLDAIVSEAGDQAAADEEVGAPQEIEVGEPSGTAVLSIRCHKASWIEVSVAGEKQLAEQVPAGQTRSVEGSPPFDVLVGNVNGVTVDYEGVEIDLAPFTRGKIARFTLGE